MDLVFRAGRDGGVTDVRGSWLTKFLLEDDEFVFVRLFLTAEFDDATRFIEEVLADDHRVIGWRVVVRGINSLVEDAAGALLTGFVEPESHCPRDIKDFQRGGCEPDMTEDSIAQPCGSLIGQVTLDGIFAKFAIAFALYVDDAEGDLEGDVGLVPEERETRSALMTRVSPVSSSRVCRSK